MPDLEATLNEDIILLNDGHLRRLIKASRLAVTDWREDKIDAEWRRSGEADHTSQSAMYVPISRPRWLPRMCTATLVRMAERLPLSVVYMPHGPPPDDVESSSAAVRQAVMQLANFDAPDDLDFVQGGHGLGPHADRRGREGCCCDLRTPARMTTPFGGAIPDEISLSRDEAKTVLFAIDDAIEATTDNSLGARLENAARIISRS